MERHGLSLRSLLLLSRLLTVRLGLRVIVIFIVLVLFMVIACNNNIHSNSTSNDIVMIGQRLF